MYYQNQDSTYVYLSRTAVHAPKYLPSTLRLPETKIQLPEARQNIIFFKWEDKQLK